MQVEGECFRGLLAPCFYLVEITFAIVGSNSSKICKRKK